MDKEPQRVELIELLFQEDGRILFERVDECRVEPPDSSTFRTSQTYEWRSDVLADDHPLMEDHLKRLQAGEAHSIEYRSKDEHGSVIWLRDTAQPIWRQGCSSPIGARCARTNFSDRKMIEQALRLAIKERDLIMNSVSDLLLFIDRDFRVRWANPIAAKTAGLTLEEMVGQRCYELWCAQNHECDDCRLRKVLESGEEHEHETSTPDGRIWRVRSSPAFGEDGEIVGAVQVGADITALSHVEEQLERTNQRLEEALTELQSSQKHLVQQERLAAVGQLAAGIAHDFSNILGPIVLYSEMVLGSDILDAVNDERMRTIIQQAQRGGNLTAQILDFSSQSIMERQILDLIPFLKELIKLLRRTLQENTSIELLAHCEDCMVVADPARMQQVCMNLALNARDAMPEGGALTFELSREEYASVEELPLKDLCPGVWAVLKVVDTGEGIKPEILPNIFEPFFTTKPPGHGNGLGLPQVYGLVRQHEGQVHVSSVLGEGTIFTLYFPAQMDHNRRYVRDYGAVTIPGNGECILVVEDELVERAAVVDALRMLGYSVVSAANGQEALDLLEEGREDVALVISDLIMPEMGGEKLFQVCESRFPGVGFIIMTGYPLRGEARERVESRALRSLQKPINIETLSREVSRALPEKSD